MRHFPLILALVAAVLYGPAAASADTRYVVDQLVITLRQGESTEYKILKTLKSDTPVEVLAEGETYLKVRTDDGTEGFVLSQYITREPPKSLRIKELENVNRDLQERLNTLEKAKNTLQNQLEEVQGKYVRESSELTQKSTSLEQDIAQARENEQAMTEKYNTLASESENVIATVTERDVLRQENARLQTEVSELQENNKKFSDTRMIKWFLAGGGVFLFGWLIGKISRKKRSRY